MGGFPVGEPRTPELSAFRKLWGKKTTLHHPTDNTARRASNGSGREPGVFRAYTQGDGGPLANRERLLAPLVLTNAETQGRTSTPYVLG